MLRIGMLLGLCLVGCADVEVQRYAAADPLPSTCQMPLEQKENLKKEYVVLCEINTTVSFPAFENVYNRAVTSVTADACKCGGEAMFVDSRGDKGATFKVIRYKTKKGQP